MRSPIAATANRARGLVLLLALGLTLPALAQPKLPPAPAPPAVPSAPALPSVPAVPSAPALPSAAVPSASAPAPLAPKPQPRSAAAPAAPPPAPPASSGGPVDANYQLYRRNRPTGNDDTNVGIPPTLPPELKRGAGGGARPPDNRPLTIEDLENAPVVSASNRAESARTAPTKVVVITGQELRARGYTELSQLLDDLPGMDVVRPYGDVFFRSYWRGERTGSGGAEPYLVVVDGIPLNHLLYRDAQILATFPLTNIDHVEVAYGPASVIFGSNATSGVIHVFTRDGRQQQERGEGGTWLDSRQTYGGPQSNLDSWSRATKQLDTTMLHVARDFRLRLSARLEDSTFDRSAGENVEYTKERYRTDPRIWPATLASTYPNLADRLASSADKRALDGRLYIGNAELGVQYFTLSTGLGTRYPSDRQRPETPWLTSEFLAFGRHVAPLSGSVRLTSLLEYRQSRAAQPVAPLTSAVSGAGLGTLAAGADATITAFVLQEDLNATVGRGLFSDNDTLDVGVGLKLQHMTLDQGFGALAALATRGLATGAGAAAAAAPGSDAPLLQAIDEIGSYVLARYTLPPTHNVHLGARVGRNALADGAEVMLRGGYVAALGPMTARLMAARASDSPGPFDLIAARRAGNTSTLRNEITTSLGGGLGANIADLVLLDVDAYYINASDPIVGGANLQNRQIAGLDAGAQLLLSPLRAWAYYSRIFTATETSAAGEQNIGDLAYNKLWAGLTFDKGPVAATLLGRFVGARETVASNPVREVPWFLTLDAALTLSHVGHDAVFTSLRVANLLGTRYVHPGTDLADSGITPGVFGATGYRGSAGAFSSLHPQPGRSFYLTLGLELLRSRAVLCCGARRQSRFLDLGSLCMAPSTNNLDFTCDWVFGYNLSSKGKGTVGYLLFWSGCGGLNLAKDTTVFNPFSDQGQTVVSGPEVTCIGLMESFHYEGGEEDPIRISAYVSQETAANIRAKLSSPLQSTKVKVQWYIIAYDNTTKKWFEAALIKDGAKADANIDTTKGQVQMFISNSPTYISESLDVQVFRFEFQIVPAAGSSTNIEFATSPSQRMVKKWTSE